MGPVDCEAGGKVGDDLRDDGSEKHLGGEVPKGISRKTTLDFI